MECLANLEAVVGARPVPFHRLPAQDSRRHGQSDPRGGDVRMIAVLKRALIVAASLFAAAIAWADGAKPVVVELFTSQGCSSCPPADRILGRLADRDDVIALGFHVNYWDRLGWPDPFATKAGTDRQYAYSPALGRRNVYTPQMVVDGALRRGRLRCGAADGSHRPGGSHLASAARSQGSNGADRAVSAMRCRAGDGAARVHLVRFARKLDQDIERGENAGRRLSYSNVVREVVQVVRWNGAAMESEIEVDTAQDAAGGVALLVQDSRSMRMLGAAKLAF